MRGPEGGEMGVDPKGGVSGLQEKQLTTLGGNITALEIDGSFDDCQRLVKSAFLEPGLGEIPERLAILAHRAKHAIPMPSEWPAFLTWLEDNIR